MLGLLVAAVIALFATSSASGQSKPKCIDLPTSFHNAVTGPGGGGTSDYTCTFSKTALTYACQIRSKSSVGVLDQAVVSTFASLDDVVDQFSVNPGVTLAAKMQMSGMGQASTTTYTFDAKKRPLKEITDGPGYTTTLNYTAWDTSGRPTKSRSTSTTPGSAPIDDEIVYDDAARSVTHTRTGGAVVNKQVIEFTAKGHQLRTTAQYGTAKTIVTATILTTENICR